MEEVPRINELKEDNSKFIQVYINNEPYLRYAHKSYHGWILIDLLSSKKVDFNTFLDKDLEEHIPLGAGKNYEIVGAGKADYLSENVIKFYDHSGRYQMGPNLKHLEDIFKDKSASIKKFENLSNTFVVSFNNSNNNSKFNLPELDNTAESDEVPF
jgi:hypothetical protein